MFKSCDSHALCLVMERALNMTTEQIVEMKQNQKRFVECNFSAESILAKYISYLDRL